MTTRNRRSRLQKIDHAAGFAAERFVLGVLALCAFAVVAYIALWALELLSWGSSFEDYVPWLEMNVSPEAPSGCDSARFEDLTGREFHVAPHGC